MAGLTKYIFISGGVTSSLGAGVVSASLGKLLKASGYSVALFKLDPYINVNSGMLNPYEHGEVYVTADGHEGDIDLGTYERFLDQPTSRNSEVTAGRVYQNVIRKERQGSYLGHTVQVVPHITNEIKQHVYRMSNGDKVDFVITEISGTVGDIESLPFIETERQVRCEVGADRFCSIHMTLVPYLHAAKELKTKPTQHSVKQMLECGVQPDMMILRTEHELNERTRAKVGLFCNVQPECVFELMDQPTVYDVPVALYKMKMVDVILKKFGMSPAQKIDLSDWSKFTTALHKSVRTINVGLVGKYVEHPDAYKSIRASLIVAAASLDYRLELTFLQSEKIDDENVARKLEDLDAVIVAPGFGQRGVDGKVTAVKYARMHNIPFFGIGLGMQCAVLDILRNVAHIDDIDSAEINPEAENLVFDFMADDKLAAGMDDTMRLGAYKTDLEKDSLVAKIYGKEQIEERHRHRFEFNNAYKQQLTDAGVVCSGSSADFGFVDIIELPSHPWFIGTSFHPEFNSSVQHPHPLFVSFIKAAIEKHGTE